MVFKECMEVDSMQMDSRTQLQTWYIHLFVASCNCRFSPFFAICVTSPFVYLLFYSRYYSCFVWLGLCSSSYSRW